MTTIRFVEGDDAVRFVAPAEVESPQASVAASGLALPNDVDVETVAADLGRFTAIALDFPKWTDGRAYTQARLLRVRFGYTGEIRARGDVVADMLPLLQRTGFSAVELRADQDRATAEAALAFFPAGHYQGDVAEPRPLFGRGRADARSDAEA